MICLETGIGHLFDQGPGAIDSVSAFARDAFWGGDFGRVQMQSGLENTFEGFEVICPSQLTLEWDALNVEFRKKHFRKWAVIYG